MKKEKTAVAVAIVATLGALFIWSPMLFTNRVSEFGPGPKNISYLKNIGAKEVVSKEVNYFKDVNGFYAEPKSPGNYPGVVMIHEWWGLNDNIKEMAKILASEGYRVLAVDLHHGNVATAPEEALSLVKKINQKEANDNLKSAVNYLRMKGSPKIASLGWCFGGGQSLQLSLSGEKLDATVIYYGNLVTDEKELSKIKWPVLGIFGDQDTVVPVDGVEKFEAGLEKLGTNHLVYMYRGVGHAFANPSGDNFAPEETRDAWYKTTAFLRQNLGK